MKIHKAILVLIIVWLGMTAVSPVAAQSPVPGNPSEDDVNRVAKKLYCPVCPNTPLDVCETKACKDWRAQIKTELTAGWSDQQVIAYFVNQYGQRVLAEPERRGFTSLVWVLPVVAVLAGGIFTWQILRSWRSRSSVHSGLPTPPDISPQTLAEIESELRKME
jgi:cytochrome c-type biogenesis protein CcmH